MKLIKKLQVTDAITATEDGKNCLLGWIIVRAMDYDKEIKGHLLMVTWRGKLAKLFMPF